MLSLFTTLFALAGATAAADWSYSNSAAWSELSSTCAGESQSPVNLNSLKSLAVRSSNIVLSQGCNFSPNTNFTVTDLNYTLGVYFPPSIDCTVRVSKSPPARLSLVVFHMGSEHAIDNAHYGMESQWYFERGNRTEVAMSIMLAANFVNIDETAPATFASAVMANLPPAENFRLSSEISMSSWVEGKSFFTYNGSLTVPPCAETVEWIVVKEPVHVTRNIHLRFSNAMRQKGADFEEAGGNARPLKPLGSRQVVYHITDKELDLIVISAKKSTNIHIVLYVMLISVALVVVGLGTGAKIDAAIVRRKAIEREQNQKQQMDHPTI